MTANPDSDRLARVLISCATEPGDPAIGAALASAGAEATCDRLAHRDPLFAARIATIDPTAVLDKAVRQGIRYVVPGDPEWPSALDELGHVPGLHDRGGVPIGLWVRGPLRLDDTTARSVAIVGSRSATTYGTSVAEGLAHGVAEAGYAVVSGAAFGIDNAAHRGALGAGGATIAVLACGVDRYYPRAHENLLRHLADHGAVVSETPPGGAPLRIRFLARNRIIAALSQGTVVVEAAVRSGALNTANWADGLSRVLLAVPGPVTSAASQGVHQLIRNRGATLVTRPEEVLEALAPVGGQLALPLRATPKPRDLLAAELRAVLEAVPVGYGLPVERIAEIVAMPTESVWQCLEALHVAALVERSGDGSTVRWRLAGDVEAPH